MNNKLPPQGSPHSILLLAKVCRTLLVHAAHQITTIAAHIYVQYTT